MNSSLFRGGNERNEWYFVTRTWLRSTRGPAPVAHGIRLASVGIKDVIQPGEMKEILNRVVEAEKVAQANLIKRREETAATRSLLNTARLMDECGYASLTPLTSTAR